MPTYIYKCETHGEFEATHSIKEKLEDCPLCEAEGKEVKKVKRLIAQSSGFILNGGGWAKEGYS